MRVWSRIALVVVALFSGFSLYADHFQGDCPLSLADSTPAETDFYRSPHGVFRSGNLVYVLRGQVLTTYLTNDVGNLQIVREDTLGGLVGRETEGGVAFANNHIFVSTEAGLEIINVANVRPGGGAPVVLQRAPGAANFHYRRLAVSGNRLAGLFPSTDLPCYPTPAGGCANQIDIIDISNLENPVRIGGVLSTASSLYRGFNDIAFHSGYLIAVGERALIAFDITNPGAIRDVSTVDRGGQFLISNGTSFLGVGRDTEIDIYTVRPGMFPFFTRDILFALPHYLALNRSNPIRFSRHAFYDEANARLVTMIEEVDQMTLQAARTIAFDVFDLTVPRHEGSVERVYEDVTLVQEDEVKYNPVAVGAYVFVVGEETGLQSWGSCGVVAGRIELESPAHLTCGGASISGWVTGQHRITNVELFLDNQPLGAANLGGPLRQGVSSPTPVVPWRIRVNLDALPAGEYQLRAIGTDALNVRRQFAMKRLYFSGPGSNCTVLRRRAVR